ncbi:MAG: twin-arginine translocation signal domain-containing protein, partial [Planctomycetota bacterium]
MGAMGCVPAHVGTYARTRRYRMLLTRRDFLKASAVTAGVAITGMGFALRP